MKRRPNEVSCSNCVVLQLFWRLTWWFFGLLRYSVVIRALGAGMGGLRTISCRSAMELVEEDRAVRRSEVEVVFPILL